MSSDQHKGGAPRVDPGAVLDSWFVSLGREFERGQRRRSGLRAPVTRFLGRAGTVLELRRQLGLRTTLGLLADEVAKKVRG